MSPCVRQHDRLGSRLAPNGAVRAATAVLPRLVRSQGPESFPSRYKASVFRRSFDPINGVSVPSGEKWCGVWVGCRCHEGKSGGSSSIRGVRDACPRIPLSCQGSDTESLVVSQGLCSDLAVCPGVLVSSLWKPVSVSAVHTLQRGVETDLFPRKFHGFFLGCSKPRRIEGWRVSGLARSHPRLCALWVPVGGRLARLGTETCDVWRRWRGLCWPSQPSPSLAQRLPDGSAPPRHLTGRIPGLLFPAQRLPGLYRLVRVLF